jgi:hypothetical protein
MFTASRLVSDSQLRLKHQMRPPIPPTNREEIVEWLRTRSGRAAARATIWGATTLLLLLGFLALPGNSPGEVVCAEDLLPEGMAVTATGTAASCDGGCRAREIQPVCGMVMKICAGQPIPKGYVIDSVTSLQACRCLDYEEDAYVIRYVGRNGPRRIPPENPAQARLAPPFDNQLCAADQNQDYADETSRGILTQPENPAWQTRQGPPMLTQPGDLSYSTRNPSAARGMQPPPRWAPQWDAAPQEPFRVGE